MDGADGGAFRRYGTSPWFLISSAMFLDSAFMNAFLPATGCEEYLFPFLPRSSARCVVKEACAAVRNYQKAVETYGKSRKKTSVKPRPPKAAKHEGRRAVVIHRDECGFVLRKKRDGTLVCSVGLPLAKLKRRFDISGADVRGELS